MIDLERRTVLANVRVGASPGLARVSLDGSTVVVSNRGDNTVSIIDAKTLRVRATLPVCKQPEEIAILPDSSKAFVTCSGSSQVASIALKNDAPNGDTKEDRLMALLDVGKTPVSLALKPDGGELIVCNFDSDSISIVETGNDEVSSSPDIGQRPSRGLVTLDNSRLYVTNFGSNSVTVYDIDMGRRIVTLTVGSRPDGLALSPDQNYLLVLDTQSGPHRRAGSVGARDPEAQAAPHPGNVRVLAVDFDSCGRAAKRNRGEIVHSQYEEVREGITGRDPLQATSLRMS